MISDERMTVMQIMDFYRKWTIICIKLKIQGASSGTSMKKMDCIRAV
jgi:hypothetical protein